MPTRKKNRRKSKSAARSAGHKTFRIREDLLAALQGYAKRCDWSEAQTVNHFLAAANAGLNGDRKCIDQLSDAIQNATKLAVETRKREAILAPLRAKAREARLALRPLVQRMKAVKTAPEAKAA